MSGSKTYDLVLREEQNTVYWSLGDHGITLSADRMAFAIDSIAHEAHYQDIRQVRLHLIFGGKAGNVGNCQITLADGYTLNVMSGNQHGGGDDERAQIFRDFVPDFHARLSREDKNRIEFVSGVSAGKHIGMTVAVMALGAMCLVALGAFLYTRQWEILFTLLGAVALAYPMMRNAQANAPQRYNPDDLPEGLAP